MRDLLTKFRFLLSPRERRHLLLLHLMTLIGAAFEVVGVGAVPAFFVLIASPGAIAARLDIPPLLDWMNARSERELFIWAATGLVMLYIVKNVYLSALTYAKARFVLNRQVDISSRLFRAYLFAPYPFHLQTNAAALVRNVNLEVSQCLNSVLMPALTATMELLVIAFLLGVLLMVEPVACILAAALLGVASAVYLHLIRRALAHHGKQQQHLRKRMLQEIYQGIGAYRDARLLGREGYFVNGLTRTSRELARTARFRTLAAALPRRFSEIVAVIGMLLVAFVLLDRTRDLQSVVPTLVLFALAAVRLMPSVNRLSESISSIRFSRHSVDVVHADLLALERPAEAGAGTVTPFPLRNVIELRSVSYRYPGSQSHALEDVSLTIPKGAAVAIVGPSGSGKTTLANLILGLLEPTQGSIRANGIDIRTNMRGWQRNIGYVPQTIYLADDTIRKNIALGLAESAIDAEKLAIAVEAAQLRRFIESLPEGADTMVGEHGVRLSGGQRQRIGIARALYSDPEILVMDEATSSLDGETERDVIEAIESLKRSRTIIMIAHRLSTARKCDELIFMKDGVVRARGVYEELVISDRDFEAMVTARHLP